MKFKILYQKNKKIHTLTLKAQNYESLVKMKNFPSNIINIEKEKSFNVDLSQYIKKRNSKRIVFEFFTQLDIMLGASLTFSESIDLLQESKQPKEIEEVLKIIQNSLAASISISTALIKYEKYLGKTSLLFLKLGFENGNIKQSIHSLVEILEEDINSKDKLNDVMRYPQILIISLCISVGMIFLYVLPNFEFIFSLLKDDIPLSTNILISIKEILEKYWILVLFFWIVFIVSVLYLTQRYRYKYDKILLLKIPLFSKMIQSYYFYRLFLSLCIIVKSKYQFQVAIENSKNIVNNLYVQKMMKEIMQNIQNGMSVADAFERTKLFDSLTMKLLNTADNTNNYEDILENITVQHKKHFHKSLKNFSSALEPMLIFLISLIVLWLILAIMLPIWNLGAVIN